MKNYSITVIATALAWGSASVNAADPAYPTRAITLVVSSAASGPLDTTARIVADHLSKAWGHPVIVDNRPGANGTIGSALVAKAPADGYTLLYTTRAISMNAALYSKLPYETKAFTPIVRVLDQPNMLVVSKKFAARDVPTLMKLLRENPGKYNYASTGSGGVPHIAGETFKKATGTSIMHIPYKGAAPLMNDIIGGTIDMTFSSPGTSMAFINDGQVFPVAIASAKRSPLLPNVPTFAEFGIQGVNVDSWYGIFAPPGTPDFVVKKVHQEANRFLRTPEAARRFEALGASPAVESTETFKADFEEDLVFHRKLALELGLKVE